MEMRVVFKIMTVKKKINPFFHLCDILQSLTDISSLGTCAMWPAGLKTKRRALLMQLEQKSKKKKKGKKSLELDPQLLQRSVVPGIPLQCVLNGHSKSAWRNDFRSCWTNKETHSEQGLNWFGTYACAEQPKYIIRFSKTKPDTKLARKNCFVILKSAWFLSRPSQNRKQCVSCPTSSAIAVFFLWRFVRKGKNI